MANDIVAAFLARLHEIDPAVTPDRLTRLEWSLRREWGGATAYVCRDSSRWKAQRLGVELAAGTTLREAIQAVGVSQSTAYRVIGRRRR